VIIFVHRINKLVCITETACVYFAVRNASLVVIQVNLILQSPRHGSSVWSPTFHSGGLGLIPHHSMWKLWWT